MARKAKSFEHAMDELEQLTRELENGTLTLEESIKHYKKGIELANHCTTLLKSAEQEIYLLDNGEFNKMSGDSVNE